MKQILVTLFALLVTPALAQLQATGETTRQAVDLALPAQARVLEPLSCSEFLIRRGVATIPDLSFEEREGEVQAQLAQARAGFEAGLDVSCVLIDGAAQQQMYVANLEQQFLRANYTQVQSFDTAPSTPLSSWSNPSGAGVDMILATDHPEGLLAFFYVR